jgi:hypothetical protein
MGTSPIHKDPGCRAPNERCDNLSGPVVRNSTIRENVTFRARHLENCAPEAFLVNGRPIESRGRPIERRRRLRLRTSPKGRNSLPGPPQKAKIGLKSVADRRRKGSRRRPKTGIAKGRRGKRPTSKRRGGGPGRAPRPQKLKTLGRRNSGNRPSLQARPSHRRTAVTRSRGPPTSPQSQRRTQHASSKGRDRVRPPPMPQKGPTGDSPSSARGANRQNRKFSTLRTKPFRWSEGHQT